MSLSNDSKRRMSIALTSVPAGQNVVGAIGLYGGFVLNSDATVKQSTGDIQAAPDSGGAAGSYRVFFPLVNSMIQSIDWFEVSGFTPRSPDASETCAALVTGYNYDTSLNQWYITVQVVTVADYAIDPTPPQNFVIGVRAAVTYKPGTGQL